MADKRTRRVFFTALSRVFEGNKVYDAMLLWQTRFANAPDSAAADTIKAICDAMGARDLYQDLYRHLKECAGMADYLLKEDPLPQLKSYAANQSGIEDAPARSFGVLVVQIGRSLDLIEYPNLPLQIKRSLRAKGVDATAADQIETMLRDDKAKRIPESALGKYAAATHIIYVVLAEVLGPVKADEILGNSVRLVDRSKYGKAYSARNFL